MIPWLIYPQKTTPVGLEHRKALGLGVGLWILHGDIDIKILQSHIWFRWMSHESWGLPSKKNWNWFRTYTLPSNGICTLVSLDGTHIQVLCYITSCNLCLLRVAQGFFFFFALLFRAVHVRSSCFTAELSLKSLLLSSWNRGIWAKRTK